MIVLWWIFSIQSVDVQECSPTELRATPVVVTKWTLGWVIQASPPSVLAALHGGEARQHHIDSFQSEGT